MKGGFVLEVKLAEVDMRSKHNEEKISNIKNELKEFQKETRESIEKIIEENKVLHSLAVSISQLGENLVETNKKIDKVSENQERMGEKINALEHAPAKKALAFNEDVKRKILFAFVVGAIGYLLGGIFPFLTI